MAHHTGVNYVVSGEPGTALHTVLLLEIVQHRKLAVLLSHSYRLEVRVPVWCDQFIHIQFIITVLAPLQTDCSDFCGRMVLSPKTSVVIRAGAVGCLLCAC